MHGWNSCIRDPTAHASQFFEELGRAGADDILRTLRPPPASPNDRARAIAFLPKTGEVSPDRAERARLAKLEQVLSYHRPTEVFAIKFIDVRAGSRGDTSTGRDLATSTPQHFRGGAAPTPQCSTHSRRALSEPQAFHRGQSWCIGMDVHWHPKRRQTRRSDWLRSLHLRDGKIAIKNSYRKNRPAI